MIITIGMTMPAIAKMIWQATTTWSQVIAQPSGPKAAWLRVIGRSALIMESILEGTGFNRLLINFRESQFRSRCTSAVRLVLAPCR
jgi:hypothetical protein